MGRIRGVLARVPRARLLALGGLMLGTVGSCSLPSIKPPGL
jgi:hypothetical protein